MDTKTVTLSEFLLARIGEDEAVARKAMEHFSTGVWTRDGASIYAGHPADDVVDWVYNETWEHIARHDPSRVLAECAAKRRIVELRYSWNLQAERMSEPPFGPILQAQVNTADAVLRSLALPYADHPDYDESWRP